MTLLDVLGLYRLALVISHEIPWCCSLSSALLVPVRPGVLVHNWVEDASISAHPDVLGIGSQFTETSTQRHSYTTDVSAGWAGSDCRHAKRHQVFSAM